MITSCCTVLVSEIKECKHLKYFPSPPIFAKHPSIHTVPYSTQPSHHRQIHSSQRSGVEWHRQ